MVNLRYRWLVWFLGWLYRPIVIGKENLPTTGPALYAACHRCLPDAFVIAYSSHLHPVRWISMKEITDGDWATKRWSGNGWFKWLAPVGGKVHGWLIDGCHVLPLELRDKPNRRQYNEQLWEEAVSSLKAGEVVAIFPEGRPSEQRPGRAKSVATGQLAQAQASGVDVYPIHIEWRSELRTFWQRWFISARPVIRWGLPMTNIQASPASMRELMTAIYQLPDRYPVN